jgi:hypothetical protein
MLDVFMFLCISVSNAIYIARHCIVTDCIHILCIVIIYWMNVGACWMFLYFVLSVNEAIYTSRQCIVIERIHIFSFYCSWDDFFACMLDLCNDRVTCTLCC